MRSRTIPILLLMAASLILPLIIPWGSTAQAITTPTISITNASALEGDIGTGQIKFNITLSAPVTNTVTVNYATKNVYGGYNIQLGHPYDYNEHAAALPSTPSTLDGDYTSIPSSQLTFLPGQYSKTVKVTTVGNTIKQNNRMFSVNLSDAVGGNIIDSSGTGTIIDDDTSSYFRLGIGDVSMREGTAYQRGADLTINFSKPAPKDFVITATTVDNTATGVSTSTTPGGMYLSRIVTIPVTAGTISKIVTIPTLPNTAITGTKKFYVDISSTLGIVTRPRGTVELRDAQASYTRTGRRSGPPRIALVGDSVTANYQEVAKQQFERRGFSVYKYGLSAQGLMDVDWCQGQVANTVLTQSDPDYIVFESMGNNGPYYPRCYPDLIEGTPEYNAQIKTVLNLYASIFTSKGANVYWILSPGANDLNWQARVTTLNSYYPVLASTYPKSYLLDTFTPFGGSPPNCSLRETSYATPCLHLNVTGMNLFANIVNTGVK